MSTGNEHGQPDLSGELAEALREQGERAEDIASLLPALEALAQWKAPAPTQEDTQQLVAMLVPLLSAPDTQALPGVSAVRAARERQARNRGAWPGRILDVAFAQVGLLRPSFWLASAFLTVLGVLVLFYYEGVQVAAVLRALGPLLAMLGVSAVFRSVRLRTLEIELSCAISPMRLALIRLALVLGYDIALGLVLSLGLWAARASGTVSNVMALMLHWLAPLLAVSGVALLLSVRLPVETAAALAYGLWLSLLVFSLSEDAPGYLRSFVEGGEALLALAGLGLLALGVARVRVAIPRVLPRS